MAHAFLPKRGQKAKSFCSLLSLISVRNCGQFVNVFLMPCASMLVRRAKAPANNSKRPGQWAGHGRDRSMIGHLSFGILAGALQAVWLLLEGAGGLTALLAYGGVGAAMVLATALITQAVQPD
jgi:hypothetical protein